MEEPITTFTCKLCGRPVSVKDCVNDDLGDPVHPSCYDEQVLEREAKLMETHNSQEIRVESFKTREQVEVRIKNLPFSLGPEQVYDPEDPSADETGHVWVVTLLPFPGAEKLHLCTDGYFR